MLAVYASRYRFASECHPRHSSISLSARKTYTKKRRTNACDSVLLFLRKDTLRRMPVADCRDDEALCKQ